MKRIAVILLALLCICLLSGCQIAQLLQQVQGEETAPEGSSQDSSSETALPEASAKPFRGETSASSSQASTPAKSVDTGSVADYIGMTYEQLAAAYGTSIIYHWFELGLYCNFDAAQITVLFDFEMIYPYYSDVSLWIEEPGEFIYSDMADPVYNFETGRFRPSDFKVVVVSVWGDTLKQLLDELGIQSPATLEMLNDSFGQIRTAEENYPSGWIEAGTYSRGDYQYRFNFDDDGRYVTSAWVQPAGDGESASDVRIMWYDGFEADDGIIWLTEPTSHGEMDGGGGAAYPLAPPLGTLFQTAPPQEGELYYVSFSGGNDMVMQLDLVQQPPEEDVLYVLTQYDETAYLMQELGMASLAEMERVFIDGHLCYTAALGTNHTDQFVQERHFAVDAENWIVYEYDVLTDSYAPLGMG